MALLRGQQTAPPISEATTEDPRRILTACLQLDPRRRPSAGELDTWCGKALRRRHVVSPWADVARWMAEIDTPTEAPAKRTPAAGLRPVEELFMLPGSEDADEPRGRTRTWEASGSLDDESVISGGTLSGPPEDDSPWVAATQADERRDRVLEEPWVEHTEIADGEPASDQDVTRVGRPRPPESDSAEYDPLVQTAPSDPRVPDFHEDDEPATPTRGGSRSPKTPSS